MTCGQLLLAYPYPSACEVMSLAKRLGASASIKHIDVPGKSGSCELRTIWDLPVMHTCSGTGWVSLR